MYAPFCSSHAGCGGKPVTGSFSTKPGSAPPIQRMATTHRFSRSPTHTTRLARARPYNSLMKSVHRKRDRIRQDADGHGAHQRHARDRHARVVQLDEAADAENVQHRQRAQEQAGEDEEHRFTPPVERYFVQLRKVRILVLDSRQGGGVGHGADDAGTVGKPGSPGGLERLGKHAGRGDPGESVNRGKHLLDRKAGGLARVW